MDFNLYLPVNVISGKDCVIKNSNKLLSFGKSCLIVTGGKSARLSGALDDIQKALSENNIDYCVFDKIGPNPLLSLCFEGGKIARENKVDFIIGIGGGSALDAAKAVAVFATNENLSKEDIYTVSYRNKALPIVLIGTTAGTGSEVGKVSVLTNDETKRKKSISPDDCYPSLSFADPKYTCSMPYNVTVSTALDALSHAIEGFFSPKCSFIPSLFAKEAILLIWQGLKYLNETKKLPTEEIREKLYYGSLCAGITLAYCGTAFPHPLGYVLTENYGLPHGMACAAFMPELMERGKVYEKEKFNEILKITNETEKVFNTVIQSLCDTKNIKMTAEEIDTYCERWKESIPNNFKFSPGGYTKEEAQKAFSKFTK